MSKTIAIAAMVALALCGNAAVGQAQAQAQEQAQERVPVQVYGAGFTPYTAYGRAEAGGAVIVFDQAAPAPVPPIVLRRPAPPATAPLPTFSGQPVTSPVPAPLSVAPPLPVAPLAATTPAPAPVAPAPTAPPPAPAATASARGGQYVDGVYVANTDYLLSYPRNIYRMLTSPSRFDRGDWINVALVAGIGGALLIVDKPLMDFWQDDVRGSGTKTLADGFREFGETRNILFGSLAAYALAEGLDSTGAVNAKREKAVALNVFESFLLSQGLITGLKYVTGRDRPEDTDSAFDFAGPSKADANASFPSGHAGSAFALASVLSETYGPDNPWVPWVAYTVATGTALSRVDDNKHWFSDVFVAGAIGLFVGKIVTRYSPFLARNNITLLPFSEDGARGVEVAFKL